MSVDYSLHSLLVLWSVLLGVFFGFVYEFFRVAHRFHPRWYWLIFVEDLLFSLICAIGMMLLFFNLSFGRMRFYAFPGIILGFLLWYFTLGRVFRALCMRLARYLTPPLRYFKAYLCTRGGTILFLFRAENGFGAKRFIKRSYKNVSSKNRSGG